MDQIDLRVLALLQDDARMGYQELGAAVGLSAPAIFHRVRKLEERGVLTGYHAAVDPEAVGRPLLAFVRAVPGPTTDSSRLRDVWEGTTEVQECHLLSGSVGYLLKVRINSAGDLEPLLNAARRAGCEVHVELTLATVFEHRRVPVW